MEANICNKLLLAQMKDVNEMQMIYAEVALAGDANRACAKVIGNMFNLSREIKEGIEQNALV
ncbi:hypothetical protein ACHHV8_25650 [Paenibacillus sp. TAB 01]|uniref:hypothetical protein n=1 Tax=Paenibacillus sp. TAB 01 TaxID=3368988 RepID=UPI0037516DE5